MTDDPRMGEFDRLMGKIDGAVWNSGWSGAEAEVGDLRAWVAEQVKRCDTLAAFARTAPGRLPAEVQTAVDSVPWDGEAVRALASEPVADELPAGERAELVKRLREEARTWRELIEEEAVGNRLDKPVFYFERAIALIEHAADALEAGERTLHLCGWCGKEMDRRAEREPKVSAGEFFARYSAGIESERRLDPDGGAESRPVSAIDGDGPDQPVPAGAAPSLADRVDGLYTRLDYLTRRLAELEDRLERLAARETPIRETQPAERVTGEPQNDGHGHSHEHT